MKINIPIEKLNAGSADAHCMVYKKYFDEIKQRIEGKIKDEKKSLQYAADTFHLLKSYPNKFRSEKGLKSWLYKTADNKSLVQMVHNRTLF